VVPSSHQVLSSDLDAISIASSTTDERFHSGPVSVNPNDIINSAVEEEYDSIKSINEYDDIPVGDEPLTAEEEQCRIYNPASRPWPVLPIDIYNYTYTSL